MSENIIGIVVLPSGEKCIPIPSVPPPFIMFEVDDENMPKAFIGIITISLVVTLILGAYVLSDSKDPEEPIEVHYTMSAYCAHGPERVVTVHLAEPVEHPENILLVGGVVHSTYLAYSLIWNGLWGTATTSTEGGVIGGPLPVDDLHLECKGYRFILDT